MSQTLQNINSFLKTASAAANFRGDKDFRNLQIPIDDVVTISDAFIERLGDGVAGFMWISFMLGLGITEIVRTFQKGTKVELRRQNYGGCEELLESYYTILAAKRERNL